MQDASGREMGDGRVSEQTGVGAVQPISLSTAWFGPSWTTPEVVEEVRRLGFTAIEWGISGARLEERVIADAVKAGVISVSSVHAIAGSAVEGQVANLDPRGVQLGSADAVLRQATIDGTCQSVDLARRLGARAVVIHAGGINEGRTRDGFHDFMRRYVTVGMTDAMRLELETLHDQRRLEVGPFFERTVESLREVVQRVGEFPMGIESRYHIYDLPLLEELPQMWREIGYDCFGYWHDFGHARMQQTFSDIAELRWLELFAERTVGMHIHDMVGVHDHAPPGQGELDIRSTMAMMAGRDYVPVMEINSAHSPEAVKLGREYVERLMEEMESGR
jgi:sugar phosphate isomerase/epimerase